MSYRNRFLLIMLSSAIVFYSVVGGLLGRVADKDGSYSQLSVFTEVLYKVRSSYVEDANITEVMHGALRGLLESLDPYSTFLTPDEYSRYRKHKSNGSGDIGLELSKEKMLGYVYVIHPIEGGPAEKAGVKAGDIIESIEEVSTRDISLVQAEYLLTGNPGSTVKLKIIRAGRSDPMEISVSRDTLKISPLKAQLVGDKIGYLKVTRFTPGISEEIRAKIVQLTKSGASRIILDLRNCAGDEYDEGIKVANLFLDHGVITYSQGQKSAKKEFVADPSKAMCKLPLVVLQNYGSAAAAEIVSSAIKENRRGELVGVRTFGKASLQKLIPLDGDSAILLSTAKFYSQSGKAIQGNGVAPDFEVKDGLNAAPADSESPNEEENVNPEPPRGNKQNQEDLQLKKAIEILSKPVTERQRAA